MTDGRAVNGDDPVSNWSNFDADIESMRVQALRNGNMDWLRWSMDALIANPDDRIEQFKGFQYPFNKRELVELFTHAFQIIWPEEKISAPGEEVDIDFVDMTKEEWDILRAPGDA